MAIVTTGLNLPGARSEFFSIFDKSNAAAFFNEWATRIPSTKDEEKYRWLGALSTMKEWGTGRKAQPLYKESYDVENAKYELTLEVDRDEIADDQTGQIMQRVKQMAQRAAEHKDSLIATLLATGDAAASLCYDGQPFFSDSHSSGDSGTQDNLLAPSAVDPTDPTVAEWKTAIKAAIVALLGFKDDKGEPMNQSATGLVAVVPPQQFFAAHEALAATVIDSTTNILSGAAKVVAFSRLTDASKWFLLKTDVALRPFIFQDREPIEFKALEADSEPGFMREVFQYGVRARYRLAYAAWQHAVQLDFA